MATSNAAEPLLARLPGPIRKVAFLRASRIGDFLCAVPAVRALRAALPEAEFTWIGLPFVRDLVARSPHLDHFVEFPGFPGLADQFFDARRAVAFLAAMQAERFDLALQVHGSGVYSNPAALLLGARATAGFIRPGDPPGRLDAALPFPESGHEVERLLALSAYLGAPERGRAPEFPLWDEDRRDAAALLATARAPLIGVHPGARDVTKRWPPQHFAAVARALLRDTGGTVLLLGSADVALAAGAMQGLPVLNLVGQTSLGALGAVLEQCSVLITNDSGPAHIAYALGTPTVTIFGSTDPARWGPPLAGPFRSLANPVPCWPCGEQTCSIGLHCLAGITVEQVTAAARDLVRQPESHEATKR